MENRTEDLVDRYIALWNERDAHKRKELVAEVFTAGCRYTDPHGDVNGLAGVDGYIAAVQERMPGVRLVRRGGADHHHDVARFGWCAMAEGVVDAIAIGLDVIVVEGDRIARVHGFHEPKA